MFFKKFAAAAFMGSFIFVSTGANASDISVASSIPWAENNRIAKNIKTECTLPTQLSEFIQSFAKSRKITVNRVDELPSSGKVLEVEIVDSVSSGNAFTGHRKLTQVSGTLKEDGKAVASFEALRVSGGGAFGGYKGSCSVLGRTVKAIGKDIALWLEAPEDGAQLGDL